MPKNLRFWTNVGLIAFAHILVIVALIRWSRESKNASAQSVVWLNGGGGDGLVTEKKNLPAPLRSPLPRKESETDPLKERQPDEARPYLASAASDDSTAKESKESPATQTGSGKGTALGNGSGRAGGAESQFGWYGSMLHDRFYSEWVQPTTLATTGSKNSVLVKLRIEKDGRVSSFEIVRPSGSSDLDESVKALANRVSRVEPLPDGLGKGDHYDVKINFELNSE